MDDQDDDTGPKGTRAAGDFWYYLTVTVCGDTFLCDTGRVSVPQS